MQKEKMKHLPNTVKANLLLHAYLTGVDCPPKLKDDQNMILSKSMHLIEAMLELSSQMRWLQTTKFIIQFSQLVTQGLWVKDSGLLQIPHFTSQEVKRALSGKWGNPVKTCVGYAKIAPEGLRKDLDATGTRSRTRRPS